ncbi:MAG TPA: 30S ribosomal protein S6 [Candidatus Limnocylindrales bacterium]
MRRYELMLILRPDLAEDRIQATIDRATRSIIGSGGQIIKVSPWGRRRLAYAIGAHREGSYHIVVFDAPSEAIAELERNLHITEEVIRHLVTHVERPTTARRSTAATSDDDVELSPPDEDEPADDGERIDESESEAAPAAIE